MFLKTLRLKNFRSFFKKSLPFLKGPNLIVGPNASGKTNITEAIYFLATGKSFRADKEKEMINYQESLARVEGEVFLEEEKITLEILLIDNKENGKGMTRKIYKVNGVNKRRRDFLGNLRAVLFNPESINIILGAPSLRRNYLDSVLEQVDWQYRASSLAYLKALKQRNRLLDKIREGEAKPEQLFFWNQTLIKNGSLITKKRQELIDFLNQYLEPKGYRIYYDLSAVSEERLKKYLEAEIALGNTLVGPHRDNLEFFCLNSSFGKERNLNLFGSRGEQRMAVLFLKMAEFVFLQSKTGQKPILLLDDVFSELDKKHRKIVLESVSQPQTIITGTEENLISQEFRDKMKIIKLSD